VAVLQRSLLRQTEKEVCEIVSATLDGLTVRPDGRRSGTCEREASTRVLSGMNVVPDNRCICAEAQIVLPAIPVQSVGEAHRLIEALLRPRVVKACEICE